MEGWWSEKWATSDITRRVRAHPCEVRRPESSESRLTGRVCDPSPVTLHGLERRDGILSAFCLQFLRDFRDGVGLLSSIRGRFVREGLSSFTGDVGDDEEEEGTEEGDSGELVAE